MPRLQPPQLLLFFTHPRSLRHQFLFFLNYSLYLHRVRVRVLQNVLSPFKVPVGVPFPILSLKVLCSGFAFDPPFGYVHC